MANNRDLNNLNVSDNPALHPDPLVALGSLLEDFGLAKVAMPQEAHVPFDKAMNGTALSFLAPDWMVWGAIGASLVYSAIKMRLIWNE